MTTENERANPTGRQCLEKLLRRIASYGVDGLEGVAFPPLCDVQLDKAMALTGDRFIVAASCNTAFTTPWSTLLHFRDAWRSLQDSP